MLDQLKDIQADLAKLTQTTEVTTVVAKVQALIDAQAPVAEAPVEPVVETPVVEEAVVAPEAPVVAEEVVADVPNTNQ
jgi:hypothetical protein